MSKANPERDNAETPQYLFDVLDAMYGFELDVCASENNAKCKKYIGATEAPKNDFCFWGIDGLECGWYAGNFHWCNPPYSKGNCEPWFHKAIHEAKERRASTAILTHDCYTAKWFNAVRSNFDRIWLPPNRVQFVAPPGVTYSSNTRGSMISIITPASVLLQRGPDVDFLDVKAIYARMQREEEG